MGSGISTAMTITLNHTIVWCRDKKVSAGYLTEILGLGDAGEINHNDNGRGVYFKDPDGHLLEIITSPYGSGG